jgi:ribonucleoside-diphosphate reductase alpha chain
VCAEDFVKTNNEEDEMDPVKTSEGLPGIRVRQRTASGHLHMTVVVDPKIGRELEIFAQIGKSGGIPAGNLEAICRMISLFLRIGGALEQVVEQLEGIGSNNEQTVVTQEGRVTGLGDALSKALQRYLDAKAKHGLETLLTTNILDTEEGG